MWGRKKKKETKDHSRDKKQDLPMRDISLYELRQAIQSFTANLPEGIELQTIINTDNTIDYHFLAPYLKAIPHQTYYMSRETYDVFEDKDRQIAIDLDRIQQAVDKYVQQNSELPIIEGDPYRKVNFFKLERAGLLTERPDRAYYITKDEYMITYQQPGSE
ncbi:DUF3939 domain-containing protein [Pontibacillus salicampi]|uniref:DUF3939 domain-containing protein n=1 Tax=Pontibacillus salicampi TaxID=1449801 RepID=A0ABV6LM99_9BACI